MIWIRSMFYTLLAKCQKSMSTCEVHISQVKGRLVLHMRVSASLGKQPLLLFGFGYPILSAPIISPVTELKRTPSESLCRLILQGLNVAI